MASISPSKESLLARFSLGVVSLGTLCLGVALSAPAKATTLTSATTFGNEVAGMQVTATFLGGTTETVTWGATGAGSGGVTGTGWTLNQAGDTFSQPWTLTNGGTPITSLVLNAIPGNGVFDLENLNNAPNNGTPGSSNGTTFRTLSGQAPTSFNYSVPIDISVGDLFGTLSLGYGNGFTGTMTYLADMDSGTTDDPVKPAPVNPAPNQPPKPTPSQPPKPPGNSVPTPAMLPAMLGFAWGVLRKRKAETGTSSEAVTES
jgi:hypothetical protein